MNIIFLTHPTFVIHQSMPRFANMLIGGMQARGHQVEVWSPKALFVRFATAGMMQKWLGYIDQYIVFPIQVHLRLKHCPADTLFVFTDQALGPWVPLTAKRPHAIHCHDFLAQHSALGQIQENPTSWTGRQYQAYIRWGYSYGKHFISVSKKTRADLHKFLPTPPLSSNVVYNGLNQEFKPHDVQVARTAMANTTNLDATGGYLLHVGGNQWYKNRQGVVELYNAWRAAGGPKLPLLLIGQAPDKALANALNHSNFKNDIHCLSDMNDELVRLAYAGATLFLFPSLAEGFGWPIAEAMAAGCPVITTAEAPMTEVGHAAAFYIPHRSSAASTAAWVSEGVKIINQVLQLSSAGRNEVITKGLANAERFDTAAALDHIEAIYQKIVGRQ